MNLAAVAWLFLGACGVLSTACLVLAVFVLRHQSKRMNKFLCGVLRVLVHAEGIIDQQKQIDGILKDMASELNVSGKELEAKAREKEEKEEKEKEQLVQREYLFIERLPSHILQAIKKVSMDEEEDDQEKHGVVKGLDPKYQTLHDIGKVFEDDLMQPRDAARHSVESSIKPEGSQKTEPEPGYQTVGEVKELLGPMKRAQKPPVAPTDPNYQTLVGLGDLDELLPKDAPDKGKAAGMKKAPVNPHDPNYQTLAGLGDLDKLLPKDAPDKGKAGMKKAVASPHDPNYQTLVGLGDLDELLPKDAPDKGKAKMKKTAAKPHDPKK